MGVGHDFVFREDSMTDTIIQNSNPFHKKNRKRQLWTAVFIVMAFIVGYIARNTHNQTDFKPRQDTSGNKESRDNFDYETFWEVWDYVKENYVDADKVSDEKLFYGALQGVVSSSHDPYSVFFEPATSQEFQDEISGIFEGIGAEIGIRNNQLTIVSPLPESPAERSGLKGGDLILMIDGKSTNEMSLGEAVTLIRGPRNSKVILSIFRQTEGETRDISIVRDAISIQSVEWKMRGTIAEIQLKYFNEDTLNDFKSAVHEILLKNPKGLILDIRNNPGGLLRTAIEITSYWVGTSDIIVIEKKRDGSFLAESGYNRNNVLKGIPTVVLINRGSASGSEILAGALQDYRLATLVGEKSFGKGSVQDLRILKDGSSVKLTIAKWLTPKGREINETGIAPDVEVTLTEEDWNAGKDPQLEKALEILGSQK